MAPVRTSARSKDSHLGTIRAVVNRMVIGSVVLRAWSVLIVGALVAITADPVHARFSWLAIFMAICFWMLDAHLLRQARLYRKVHDRVRNTPESEIDFLLDTSTVDTDADAFRIVAFSLVPGIFYAGLIASVAVARFLLRIGE
jgi:Kef-type K+ transport system membrane component KefB